MISLPFVRTEVLLTIIPNSACVTFMSVSLPFNYVFNKKFSQLVFKYSDSSILATDNNKLYKSLDYGVNWSFVDSLTDNINVLEIDPDNENLVYAGTNRGLYKSSNSGQSFYMFNNSFTPSRKILGLVKDAYRNFIYVVTEEAVYKCWNNYLINIEQTSNVIPKSFYLYQNYPNPFNPLTTIKFDIPKSSFIKLKIFDIGGKELETLVNEKVEEGSFNVKWNGRNYPSGVYFYRIEADNFVQTKTMVLVK